MDKINILEAISIGIVVATFLLNTSRVLRGIEFCKECLILLNSKALEKHKDFAQLTYIKVYLTMLKGYNLINDRQKEGERAFGLAEMYHLQSKYSEANEVYQKALSIMIETGERFGEAKCYVQLADVIQSLSDYGKAKEYLEKALVICKEIGNREVEATCYVLLGTVFRSQGEYGKAEKYLEKALLISKEIGNRKEEAECYRNLGAVFRNLGNYGKAKEYLKRALVISKDVGDKGIEGYCYGNLGNVLLSLGEFVKAEEYIKKGLVACKENGDRRGEATGYGNLGCVFQSLGKYGEAGEYQNKALVIRKEIGDRRGEAACYKNLGRVFRSLYEYSKAEEYTKKALVIFQEIGDRKEEANCYEMLGQRFLTIGEYRKAEEQYREALVIAKKIGDRGKEAACYTDLGTTFQYRGEYGKAEECQREALVISQNNGNRKLEASCYVNLGNMFLLIGEYGKADEHYSNALVITNEIGHKEGEAKCYQGLGGLFHWLGEYGKAEEYQKKALAIMKEISNKEGEADCYGNLGTVFESLVKYGKAEEYQKRALAIRIEIGDRRGKARCYGNLGTVMVRLRDYSKAEEYLEKALVIRKEIGDREGEAICYGNLGRVFSSLGEQVKAEEYHKKALSISEETGHMLTQLESHLFLALAILLDGRVPLEEAFSNLFACIRKCEKMQIFLRDKDQFKISFLDKHVHSYRLLSRLFCYFGHDNEAICVEELGRARALGDLMSARYHVKHHISENPLSWVGIEGVLNKEINSTFLYISYLRSSVSIWVLKANKPIVLGHIDVNECFVGKRLQRNVDEIFSDEKVRNFQVLPQNRCEDRSLPTSYAVYRQPKSSQEEDNADLRLIEEEEDEDQRPPPTLAECYKMIIAPVVNLLEEPEIIIVPDRSFYKIPFAALSEENEKYLSETYKIRIVPSLSTLKLIQDSPADYHSQAGALLVGDPDVGTVVYKGNIEKISSLPCARREAEMIGRLLGVEALVGKQATKQAVLQSIHSVSLIHFAAHGDAERGEIALAPVESIDVHPQEEHYLLTMSDISHVQLRAKLVVLSCCHSARGAIKAEGVVGIARAFLGSGARSVLVALWAIPDEATEKLMSHFYEHLVRGESASESLHEAMKWMRSNGYSKVREWAPFMLIGDNVAFAEFSK